MTHGQVTYHVVQRHQGSEAEHYGAHDMWQSLLPEPQNSSWVITAFIASLPRAIVVF